MQVLSSYLTFPGIAWWMHVAKADAVILDASEHFQKMSYRNRYRISGSNGSILLTVPLAAGREQKRPMKEITIFNDQNWQIQHWRTLVSVYKRSPYFDHFEPELKELFGLQFEHLCDFNLESIKWAQRQLRLPFEIKEINEYQKKYPEATDLRNVKEVHAEQPKYYQVFEERIGFIPGLSILDLLFSEGPAARSLLVQAT
jgi:hypothetical protein